MLVCCADFRCKLCAVYFQSENSPMTENVEEGKTIKLERDGVTQLKYAYMIQFKRNKIKPKLGHFLRKNRRSG